MTSPPYLSDLFNELLHIDVYAPISDVRHFRARLLFGRRPSGTRAGIRVKTLGAGPVIAHLAVGILAWVT